VLGMPVLVALNAADTALAVEALTDQQAVGEAMQVNLHMLGGGGGGGNLRTPPAAGGGAGPPS
jgi:hypothetical protein